MTHETITEPPHPADKNNRRNRRVIHATCMLHPGPIGFVNLAVRKIEAPTVMAPNFIEFDPHVTGTCVIRLLTADNLARQTYGIYITICGEDLPASDLPPSCYDGNSDNFDHNPAYCPECVREAARWNAEPEQARPESAARAPTDT